MILVRRALLFFGFVAPVLAFLLWGTDWRIALGLLLLSHILILIPTLVANCQWWGPVVTAFSTEQKEIWLTIDDGPDPVHTPRILEILQRYQARATFFLVGKRADEFPHLVAQIRGAGHEIAHHTYSHQSGWFWCYSPKAIARELDQFQVETRFFRAPAGLKNFFVHPALAERGLALIGWTVRGLDTVSHNSKRVAARVMRGARSGAIVLLHEAHRTKTDPEFHPRCLEETLAALTEAGYRCVLPKPEQLRLRVDEKQTGDC